MSKRREMGRKRKRNRRCARCGSKKNLTRHHIVPRRESGPSVSENLQTLCRPCHDFWHRCEGREYRLSFDDWLIGGETGLTAFRKSKMLRVVMTGRLTGQSYRVIAERLNKLKLFSPRGLAWTERNLSGWVRRHAEELSPKRQFELARWPIFSEAISEGVWRWYFFLEPLGICHLRGTRKVLDKYNFSRYFRVVGKVLNNIRPAHGLHVYHGQVDLLAEQVTPPEVHPGPVKQAVAFLCEGQLRKGRRTGRSYDLAGPIRRMPDSWAEHDGWAWVSWERVEPILVEKAQRKFRRCRDRR